jgi:hypothetical protein
MNEEFLRRFLAARDGGLSPFDSWRKKELDGIEKRMEFCFVKNWEYLGQADWEGALLSAAESGCRYATFNFRSGVSVSDSINLMRRYLEAYLMPYGGIALGGASAMFPANGGWISVPLFCLNQIPPESRRVALASEVHQMLEDNGCRQVEPAASGTH